MNDIRIIKGKKRKPTVALDPKKESLIKELSFLAELQGFQVRREHLKQGLGWKVISGSCRADDKQIIFVDRKLSQSDQISFLLGKFKALEISPTEEKLLTVSEETRQLLESSKVTEAMAVGN